MNIKYIISTVFIMVIALLIFSYITNPMTKYQVKEFFSEVKSDVKGSIDTIPTPEKSLCKDKAIELTPNIILLSNQPQTQVKNYWNDDSEITEFSDESDAAFFVGLANCFRAGTNEGENINYLYPLSEKEKNAIGSLKNHCPNLISYNKKIINDKGLVLGYNSFIVNLSLLKLREEQIETDEGDYDGNTDTYTFKWSGFDEEMKKLYGSNKIHFKIIIEKMSGSVTVCEDESEDENGEFVCKGLAQAGWDGKFGKCLWCNKFKIEPDIYDNKIYEIIEPNINSCNWVSDNE